MPSPELSHQASGQAGGGPGAVVAAASSQVDKVNNLLPTLAGTLLRLFDFNIASHARSAAAPELPSDQSVGQ